MKQFTLNINKKYQRPIAELKSWHNFEALLDTGAVFPIWTDEEDILSLIGGKLVKEGCSMTTGRRVAQKRKELGLSQEALGEKLRAACTDFKML